MNNTQIKFQELAKGLNEATQRFYEIYSYGNIPCADFYKIAYAFECPVVVDETTAWDWITHKLESYQSELRMILRLISNRNREIDECLLRSEYEKYSESLSVLNQLLD